MKEEALKRLAEEKREIAIEGIKRRLYGIDKWNEEIKQLEHQIELIEKGELKGNEDKQSGCTITNGGSFTCTSC